ncbi:tRNA G18 (ribose-2'-O)-methylase SpoU [Leucobacter luti]|uniref:TrmH family RNA methyltransferase n=1 Tax=Leucobacter luti TaxID=340320 RepID=UPI001051007D|nr:RNA methyltransferase [Leucobacter luti]MCW2287747.1 tRNA G18 (ribose-2'-O)-methylase SpoU [Leucobacter luti]TCK46090.1 tRNA G18 (ribose-2'-O)-methylase SpoU [Leucobacter luti]
MKLIRIDDIASPELSDYTQLTDVAMRRVREPAEGLYLAESPKVIERALRVGHRPRSLLMVEEWLPRVEPLLADFPEVPVYIGKPEQLEQLTGFNMHRGAMASMHRPTPLDPAELLRSSKRVVVLEDLADHTNVGAVFRSIAALGADAVLLTPGCADPLYRRAVRVSMGAVLQVPWARLPDWREAGPLFRETGFELTAFALRDDAEDLADFVEDIPERLALMFGTEGPGLTRRALASASRTVLIPMEHGVDSLNVATAAALAMWAVRTGDRRGSRASVTDPAGAPLVANAPAAALGATR